MRKQTTLSGTMLAGFFIACSIFQHADGASIKANLYSGGFWATKNIPVCWEQPGYDLEKAWVRDAIEKTWAYHSALTFVGWGNCYTGHPGIRIGISDQTPHVKQLGSLINGVPNGMILNFFFKSWCPSCADDRELNIKAIAVHEFGHTLSFAHEQNRPDTPEWCDKEPQGKDGDYHDGHWDATSVMNYCNINYRYSNWGTLSNGDVSAVRQYYGAPQFGASGNGQKLLEAIEKNDFDGVKKHFDARAFLATTDIDGLSPLSLAADRCRVDMIHYMLQSGILTIQDIQFRNKFKNSAIEIAKGHALISPGVPDPNPRCAQAVPLLERFSAF